MLATRCWLLVLLLCSGWTQEATTDPLRQATAHLVEAQAQLQSACAGANLVIPAGLNDVLVVRRTIAADWQRRTAAGEVRADDAALHRFAGDLEALVSGLQGLTGLAQQLADAARRFPHCAGEPAFTRYRTLVADTFTQGMQALIAGRLRDQAAPATWYARQARHTALLTLIEAGYIAEERYAALPRDDRWLIEYREHLLLTRTTVERTLDLPDDGGDEQHHRVHDAYTRLLDARVEVIDRIANSDLPADAPEVQVFRQAAEKRATVLAGQIALARVVDPGDDDAEHWRRIEAHWHLARVERLTMYAAEWLDLASEHQETSKQMAEPLSDAQADDIAGLRASMAGATEAYRVARTGFATALAADDVVAALTAKQAAERANHHLGRRLMYLHDDLALVEREAAWQRHAKDPAIAEKLREWTARRQEALAQRRTADEAALAVLVAEQAVQQAELVREAAEDRSSLADRAVDDEGLFDLIQALDDMVELRTGNAPGQ